MGSTDASLQSALRHHEAGNLAAAEQAYHAILAREPENAAAIHFLGMLAHQAGRSDRGLALLRRSVELASEVAEFHSNLALVLAQVGHPEDAVAELRRAVALQ